MHRKQIITTAVQPQHMQNCHQTLPKIYNGEHQSTVENQVHMHCGSVL